MALRGEASTASNSYGRRKVVERRRDSERVPPKGRSDRQPGASLRSPRPEHGSASAALHSYPEPMGALATCLGWLIGPFHGARLRTAKKGGYYTLSADFLSIAVRATKTATYQALRVWLCPHKTGKIRITFARRQFCRATPSISKQ